jgi:condensation enzyme
VSDGWSMQVIMRDLGAFYAARVSGTAARLPAVRQYREYSQWQKADAANPAEDGAPRYWLQQLHGSHEFSMPNDRAHPEAYSRPYSMHTYRMDADVVATASALATATRSSLFMVKLSAISVLAHQITGATDLAIRAFTSGRDEPRFQDTMGLFINLVPFRTDIGECASFRDVVAHAKETCIDAYAHELPINVIEQLISEFTKPRENQRTSQFCLTMAPSQFGDLTIPIAEGAREIRERLLQESESHDVPSGMVWYLEVTQAGELFGGVHFNLDEFDETTAAGWSADFRRIITSAVREPDRDWRTL